MHNSREKQLRSCASAHHAPKHVDAPTIAPKSPARVLLRLRAVLLLPIYHRQTRACDGWQTHYYTLSVIQNAQRNRTPHEKQARIWRTAVRKPPIAPIEPSTWPALAIRYCRPMIRSLGYLVGGKVGIDRPGIACRSMSKIVFADLSSIGICQDEYRKSNRIESNLESNIPLD